jgi:hypothetical protein
MKIEINFRDEESAEVAKAIKKAQTEKVKYPLTANRVRLAARYAEEFLNAIRIKRPARAGCRLDIFPPMVMKGLPFHVYGTAAVLVRDTKWCLVEIKKQRCLSYALGQLPSCRLTMSDSALDAFPAERKIYY